MKINHPLINKSELARRLGITNDKLMSRLRRIQNEPFSQSEEEKIKNILIDCFCYLFEANDIDIHGN